MQKFVAACKARRRVRLIVAVAAVCLAVAARAQAEPPANAKADSGLPPASVFSALLLPDRDGVVSWKLLASVEPVKQGARMVPRFDRAILALDQRPVRVQGFVLALDTGLEQKHFLISAVPPQCPYCMPAGPDAIIEVFARKPVPYGYDPIVVGGKFAVLRSDPSGVFYRLTDAEVVATIAKDR